MVNSAYERKTRAVTGRVKGPRDNKDKSVTFWIGSHPRQRFVLPKGSTFALQLGSTSRALVLFEETAGRNPLVVKVFPDPGYRLVLEHMEM